MRMFKKVAIVGVGLIGGSIALGIKKNRLAREIVGIARHKRTLRRAKKIGAIDRGSQNISMVKDADLIILAVPVNTIFRLAKKISKLAKKDSIVTDVGSTKVKIVSKLERLFPDYIGTHPLAGSQKSGIMHACSRLFRGSVCILTPTPRTKFKVLLVVRRFWQVLGAKTVSLSPKQHDRILSFVSHLPHLVAFNFMNSIPKNYLQFAASGLKDTTRIASSVPELWQDIFLTNTKEVLKALVRFDKSLHRFRKLLTRKDRRALYRFMSKAKQKRDSLG